MLKVRREVRRRIAVLSAAVAVLGVPAIVNAAVGEVDDVNMAGPCNPALSLPAENACDPAEALPNNDETLQRIAAYATTSRFAGTWIDRTDAARPLLRVGITNLTPADQQSLDSIAGAPGRVIGSDATFTKAELDAVSNIITDEMATLDTFFVIAPSVPANSVLVDVQPNQAGPVQNRINQLLRNVQAPAPVLSAVQKVQIGVAQITDLVRVRETFVGVDQAADRTTYPKHAGGLRVNFIAPGASRGEACTAGFTVTASNGVHAGMTAGHCSAGFQREDVSIGNDVLGKSGANEYRRSTDNSSDALLYPLKSQADRDDNIFVNGSGTGYRDLQAPRYTMDTLMNGVSLCFQGITSDNNNCGTVVTSDASVRDKLRHTIRHTFIIDYPCAKGDSGGPVYHVNSNGTAKAAGIIWGCDGGYAYFSQIGHALADLDSVLFYN